MTGGEMSDFLVGRADRGAAAVRVRYPEHICSNFVGGTNIKYYTIVYGENPLAKIIPSLRYHYITYWIKNGWIQNTVDCRLQSP